VVFKQHCARTQLLVVPEYRFKASESQMQQMH
jgi:hypothetical protein